MRPNPKDYDPRPEYFGELVESTGLTQKKIAEILGVDERTIRRWLSGERRFSYTVQFTLECLVLEV